MKNASKQSAVILLVALHVWGSLFMQHSHQHVFFGSADGHQSIQGLGNGAINSQGSVEECRHCLLCVRDSNANAILEFSSTVPEATVQPIVCSEIIRVFAMGMHTAEPDRGPPTVSA